MEIPLIRNFHVQRISFQKEFLRHVRETSGTYPLGHVSPPHVIDTSYGFSGIEQIQSDSDEDEEEDSTETNSDEEDGTEANSDEEED